MKRLIHEYYENYTILINNIKRFAKYIILTKLIFLAIMYPLVKATTYFLMKSKGYDYITNGILAKFLVSPQGIILLILSVILGISIILVEIGGLVVLSYQSINNLPESRFFDIVTYCLKRMKNLVRLDGVLIVIYVFVLLPLLNFGIRTSVLTTIKIPGYILDVITSNTFYFILLIISLAIIFFVTIRWIFSIHILVLAKNVKRPLSTSSKIVSKNFKGLIGYFFGMSLITLMVLLSMVFLYIILSALILMIASESVEPFIIYGLLGLGIILINISSFLFLPFQLIYITKFYLKITENYQVCLNIKYSNKKEILDKILSNKFLLVTTLVIAVISVSLYTGLFNEYFSYFNYNIKFTAHRGSSFEAPENTLAAVNRAIKLKADYVEIDIQETKDQQIVLLHDKSFKRTTGVSKEVWQLTLSEIKSLDAGVLFSKEYEGEKVPTLQEVIKLSKNKINLNIEIKLHGKEKNIVHNLIDLIKREQLINTCVVTSLDYNVLRKIEAIEPRIKTGYIMYLAIGNLEELDIDFYSVERSNVSESFVEKAHAIGREVHVWTINDGNDFEELLEIGVDNIITDKITLLRERLSKIKEYKNKLFNKNK